MNNTILNQITEWIQNVLGLSPVLQGRILGSLLLILILFIVRRGLFAIGFRLNKDAKRNYYFRNFVSYLITIVGILLVGRIWFEGIDSLATYLGLLSAGLAIALQTPITNFAGWIFIVLRRPFEVGDRIEIGGNAGDVVDITIFHFTLNEIGNWVNAEHSTGRLLKVPNAQVFSQTLANYTIGFGYIWNEIPVVVTFEADWEKAKKILEDVMAKEADKYAKDARKELRKASRDYVIYYRTLTPYVFTSVLDHGVCLTMRYLCNPWLRRTSEHEFWEMILKEFSKHDDVDFAYPTKRTVILEKGNRGLSNDDYDGE